MTESDRADTATGFAGPVFSFRPCAISNQMRPVLERIGRLPPTLEDLYGELLQKINSYTSHADRHYARHALSWLLCAHRRLSVSEFLTAISLAVPSPQRLTSDQILDLCCNLVVLDEELDTFRFAHLSVREFLEQQDEYLTDRSNAVAAESCLLSMISSARSQSSVSLLAKMGYCSDVRYKELQKYAYVFWAQHSQAAADERQNQPLRELLDGFLQKEPPMTPRFLLGTLALQIRHLTLAGS